MADIDVRFRPAWTAGFEGRAAPEPPESVEWWEVDAWMDAYERGRKAAGLGDS